MLERAGVVGGAVHQGSEVVRVADNVVQAERDGTVEVTVAGDPRDAVTAGALPARALPVLDADGRGDLPRPSWFVPTGILGRDGAVHGDAAGRADR